MSNNQPTIYEIAQAAGVSIATVSRAINPETKEKVAAKTSEKIEKAIKRLGYTPNLAAKLLVKSATRTLGVVFSHHPGMLRSDYYTEIMAGISDAVLEANYQMKMILLKPQKENWDHYDFRKGEGVDGIIVTYWRSIFSNSGALKKLGVPTVIINNVEPGIKARFVVGDHFDGGWQAAEYLFACGHRNVAVLSGNGGAPDATARLKGFLSFYAKQKCKVSKNRIFNVHFKEEEAYQKTNDILKLKPKVTAVFCMNDVQAYGVLNRLKDLKKHCPKDLSVFGYDDDRYSEHTTPPLTTVKVPVYELARQSALDLIQFLKDKDEQGFYRTQKFPVRLIERKSVGRA